MQPPVVAPARRVLLVAFRFAGLQKNADGSADIYFGPTAPPGGESNWVPTDRNGRFEVLARFYGPQQPLFDKTWQLPDLEAIG